MDVDVFAEQWYWDIENICRICLKADSDLKFIFEETIDILLSEMITECSNYPVKRYDEFPQQICTKCIDNLKVAFNFKKLCESSYKTIKEALESKDFIHNSTNKIRIETKPEAVDTIGLIENDMDSDKYECLSNQDECSSYENYDSSLAPLKTQEIKKIAKKQKHSTEKKLNTNNKKPGKNNLRKSARILKKKTGLRNAIECEICHKILSGRLSDYKRHQLSHEFPKRFACANCDAGFNRRDRLIHHIERYHPERYHPANLAFNCESCIMGFANKEAFYNHNHEIHPPDSEFKCCQCQMTFPSEEYVENHIVRCGIKKRKRNFPKNHAYTICQDVLENSKRLQYHEQSCHETKSVRLIENVENESDNYEFLSKQDECSSDENDYLSFVPLKTQETKIKKIATTKLKDIVKECEDEECDNLEYLEDFFTDEEHVCFDFRDDSEAGENSKDNSNITAEGDDTNLSCDFQKDLIDLTETKSCDFGEIIIASSPEQTKKNEGSSSESLKSYTSLEIQENVKKTRKREKWKKIKEYKTLEKALNDFNVLKVWSRYDSKKGSNGKRKSWFYRCNKTKRKTSQPCTAKLKLLFCNEGKYNSILQLYTNGKEHVHTEGNLASIPISAETTVIIRSAVKEKKTLSKVIEKIRKSGQGVPPISKIRNRIAEERKALFGNVLCGRPGNKTKTTKTLKYQNKKDKTKRTKNQKARRM